MQIGGFVLAALLLWLALRGLHFGELRHALATADYRWMPLLAALMLFAHVLRAWRWTMLLDGLPPDPNARRIRTPFAFAAVMIGYMVNYGAPRLGEVVRTTTVARAASRPFSAVLGTVVLERLLDVAALALGLLTVPLLLGARLKALETLFVLPDRGVLVWIVAGGLALLVAALLAWRVLGRLHRSDTPNWWTRHVHPLLVSFRDGLATLGTSPHRWGLAATTAAMWVLYSLIAWLPFVLLGSGAAANITPVDGWCIMLIGAIGMVVPTPGGAGSYHYITIQTLVLLYGMAEVDAQVYAVFAHGAQLVLYTLTGAICLGIVARRNYSRRDSTVQIQP